MISRRRFIRISAAAAGLSLLPSERPARSDTPVTWRGTLLGAIATMEIYHENRREAEQLITVACTEARRLERLFSLYLQDSALYASGQTSLYCTGDQLFGGATQAPDTTYTVRQPAAASDPWNPLSFTPTAGCTKTYAGFSGTLFTALNQYQQTNGVVQYKNGAPVLAATGTNGYQPQVASEFRQWVTLCSYSGTVPAGTYFVQVQGSAKADGNGHNRFALRAFGSSAAQNAGISITWLMARLSLATTPSGVPVRATMPNHEYSSKPLRPCSSSVGTSGNWGERFSEVTPSERSRPAFSSGCPENSMSKWTGTSPDSSAVFAGAEPR